MYIEPNTTIKLLGDVPLDEAQTDTLWFASLEEQISYMSSKTVVTLGNQSFQRASVGRCRLQVPIATAYKCNYMMFQNSSFFGKWFFAFVTDVEYVNNETTEIRFAIDDMQTWFFEMKVEDAFVERETVANDGIGVHIEPENLECGEYVINGNSYEELNNWRDMRVVIMYINPDDDANNVNLYGGTVGACQLKVYGTSVLELTLLNEFIASNTSHPDAIIGMYMCPSVAVGNLTGGNIVPYGSSGYNLTVEKEGVTHDSTIDTHIVKNNKLLTYPYNFYCVDSPSGDTLTCRYEFFNDGKPKFIFTVNPNYPVECTCMPFGYKGSSSNRVTSSEYRKERLSIKGYPMCSYSFDGFGYWLSQNSIPIIANLGGGLITSGLGLSDSSAKTVTKTKRRLNKKTGRLNLYERSTTEYPAMEGDSTGASMLSGITDVLGSAYQASLSANISKGSFETGNNDFSNGRMTFKGCRMSITREYARRIDKFFTAYGYAIGIVKPVSFHNRTRFTYVKTVGANVHGNMPSDSANVIAGMLDNGIRFWSDHSSVNNFELDNDTL